MGWGGCPRCPRQRPCAVQRRFTPVRTKLKGGGGLGVFRRKIHLIARARGVPESALKMGRLSGKTGEKQAGAGEPARGIAPVVAALPSDLRRCGPVCPVSERGAANTRRPGCSSGQRFTWHECSSGQFAPCLFNFQHGTDLDRRDEVSLIHSIPRAADAVSLAYLVANAATSGPPAPCGRCQRSDRGHLHNAAGTAHIIGL